MSKTIHILGITLDDFANKVNIRELLDETGLGQAYRPRCYLCKREEGLKSVGVHLPLGEQIMVHAPELKLIRVQIELKDIRFLYSLCHECMMLLRALGEGTYSLPELDAEEEE